jgi:DNA-binding transcriptional MerR regulator
MATILLTIGDFSRMTHLSVTALRHYHDVGILEPAAIDPHSGYRSYGTDQVAAAHAIKRLRNLGMPLDSIRAVLNAPSDAERNREIAAHLERMERQLEQTQAAVRGLRALLFDPDVRPPVTYRTIPPVTALVIAETVTMADVMDWAAMAISDLSTALRLTGLTQAGALGALFPTEFFEVEHSSLTLFLPVPAHGARVSAAVNAAASAGFGSAFGADRVRLTEIPGIEAAVAVHDGPSEDIDRTYGALGTVVAKRSIGVDGPIREYYPEGFDAEKPHRTEICWPISRTEAV